MPDTGPPIERLTRRLAETPADFLESPVRSDGKPVVNVAAVVSDLLVDLGGTLLSPLEAASFGRKRDVRTLTTTLIAAWMLHDDWFRETARFPDSVRRLLLGDELQEIAQLVEPSMFVTDPDRREELARICLDRLGVRPKGESQATARDRLTTLSTIERQRVIRETREAQERMRQIQEAMRRKAAQEAAPAWGRE